MKESFDRNRQNDNREMVENTMNIFNYKIEKFI